MKRVYITDCEGPLTKNDNAFEISTHFMPHGDRFFTLISRYDDILADILRRPGYKPGDTLKLILPFLKAHGVTDEMMKEFSRETLLLIPKADELINSVKELMPSFIVSTSYEHYISALCELLGFPFENTFSTKVSLNSYEIDEEERRRLKELYEEILELSIEIPENCSSFSHLSDETKEAVRRLDVIFWEEIAGMKIGRILRDVNPVGGSEKVRAVKDVIERTESSPENCMYVGDSITDAEPLRFIRENGGLSVSFNGNEYALRESEIAVISNHASVMLLLAKLFREYGKEGLLDFVREFPEAVRESSDEEVKIYILDSENFHEALRKSKEMRKKIRGEKIGSLG
ncbi:MAG: energy-converting hydrogenase subunit [Archaeoglobi archaeon]|nr:energy-converting hydrogenase subunit [Archaeoglobi archaeon]